MANMAGNKNPNAQFIFKERQNIIQVLAAHAKRNKTALQNPSGGDKILLHRLGLLLTRLDEEVQMTPDFKKWTGIDKGMIVICNEDFGFPVQYVEKAKMLLKKWESQNWGDPKVIKKEEAAESDNEVEMTSVKAGKKRKRREPSTSDEDNPGHLELPKPDHPIWGLNGIMYGICYNVSADRNKRPHLDPRYKHDQRNAKIFGHNGLKVGDWFPYQINALFEGAHGASQAGIYGTEETGAYSIVVSGQYEDLDNDRGDYLYYSGSNSHNNTDPKAPPKSTKGTLALHTSIQTGEPVRVLRTHSGKSKWAPYVGQRYDGLYTVVDVKQPLNGKGGQYEQFKLVRIEGQDPINVFRPSPQGAKA